MAFPQVQFVKLPKLIREHYESNPDQVESFTLCTENGTPTCYVEHTFGPDVVEDQWEWTRKASNEWSSWVLVQANMPVDEAELQDSVN